MRESRLESRSGRGCAGPGWVLPASLLAVLLLAGSGCLSGGAAASSAPPTSPKLNPFVYYEDGRVLFIAVDGRAAQYTGDEESLFPLGLGLANQSPGQLTFARESFVLEAEDGRQFPTASYGEFSQSYTNSRRDIRLSDSFREILLGRFGNLYRPVSWRLFPFKGEESAAQERIELGRRQVTWGYLYFPSPADGIHGKRFTLLVRPEDYPETFVVRFALR